MPDARAWRSVFPDKGEGGFVSALRPPGLGPIIGHTTSVSCRLWIQGADARGEPGGAGSDRRTVGVLGVLTKDGKKIEKDGAFYFRLQREYDRTGTFVLGEDVALGTHESDNPPSKEEGKPYKLKPDTAYTVRMGTLSIDDPMPDEETLSDRELALRLP